MIEFRLDLARAERVGVPEAIYCAGKSAQQINMILTSVLEAGGRILLTKLSEELLAKIAPPVRRAIDYDPLSATGMIGTISKEEERQAGIGIVAAGSSDLEVAREAARTLTFHGYDAPILADVGVAGLWRLTDHLSELRSRRVVIAAAGMEGALFSVLGGLLAAPIVAIPTSIGYGVAHGGRVALDAALSSCAPGVVAVNIDNGFGAAVAAIKILKAGV
jgi:pyridinium-3,5-biscarboxylic acid mononucleotide synthase